MSDSLALLTFESIETKYLTIVDDSVTFAGIGGKYFLLVFVTDCCLLFDSHPDKTS